MAERLSDEDVLRDYDALRRDFDTLGKEHDAALRALAEAERERDEALTARVVMEREQLKASTERDEARAALRAVEEACEAVSVDPGCWCEPGGRAGMHPEPHSDRCNQTGRAIAAARRLLGERA